MMNNRIKKNLLLFITVAGAFIYVMIILSIREPQQGFRKALAKVYPFAKLISQRDAIRSRVKFSTLDFYIPESFDVLRAHVQNPRSYC